MVIKGNKTLDIVSIKKNIECQFKVGITNKTKNQGKFLSIIKKI